MPKPIQQGTKCALGRIPKNTFSRGRYCKSQGSGAPERSQNYTNFHLKINQQKLTFVLMDLYWFLEAFWHHFPLKIVTIIQSKTNAFSIRKIKENWCQTDLIWEARGGSNEPAFRSLNLCWGQPGAQGDPRAPQGRPGHRPGSQHFPKWSSKCSNNDPKTTQEIPN